MMYTTAACPVRQAIDNRLNRDLIVQAREQGSVFFNPFADDGVWQRLETADLVYPIQRCGHDEAEWLFVKAFEVSLFLIYQRQRRSSTPTA